MKPVLFEDCQRVSISFCPIFIGNLVKCLYSLSVTFASPNGHFRSVAERLGNKSHLNFNSLRCLNAIGQTVEWRIEANTTDSHKSQITPQHKQLKTYFMKISYPICCFAKIPTYFLMRRNPMRNGSPNEANKVRRG